ncbi:unnamed protein product, partial [Iphiclides podalirius]
MHRSRIPKYSKVKASVTGWLFATTLVAEKLRVSILGALISITVAEVCAYKLLKQNVKAGELPPYITDLLIMLLGLLEAGVSPFVGCFGYKWRRAVMMTSCLVAGAVSFLWFALPDVNVPESVGYCHGNNTLTAFEAGPRTPIRLSIILFTFIVFGATRLLLWCHGIAYIDEHAPSRLAMHYGVLSALRMLGLVMSYNVLTELLETNMTAQTLIIGIGLLVNALQVYLNVPKVAPEIEDPAKGPTDDLSLRASVVRVFFNTLAMSQMVAMGLMAAALWGFAYHQSDYLKTKFYLHVERNSPMNNAEILRNHAVVLAVAYMGVKFTPPIMEHVVKTQVLAHVAKMCVFTLVLHALIAFVVSCERGEVAGLGERYVQPQCSRACGCAPQWQEFSPVCVVDQMTTFLSPCHAGCTGTEEVGGLRVYSNCTCASLSRRAVSGSCNSNACNGALQLHHVLFALLLSVTALAFQGQGVVILRAADVRDKPTALGLTGAIVAIFTFVCGHLIFLGVTVGSCIWWEGGRCHLQSSKYPYLISGISAAMVLFSFIITLTTVVYMKVAERRTKAEPTINLSDEAEC